MVGLTLGGGYGPLIGRFGLALDNLGAAEVVLADGLAVVAKRDSEEELFWGHCHIWQEEAPSPRPAALLSH
jgi:FAD/FMN-containing dehydrogenase